MVNRQSALGATDPLSRPIFIKRLFAGDAAKRAFIAYLLAGKSFNLGARYVLGGQLPII